MRSAYRREERRKVLSNIPSLGNDTRLPSADNGSHVLRLVECSLRYFPMSMEMHWYLTNGRVERDSKAAEVYHVEECGHAAAEDSDAL